MAGGADLDGLAVLVGEFSIDVEGGRSAGFSVIQAGFYFCAIGTVQYIGKELAEYLRCFGRKEIALLRIGTGLLHSIAQLLALLLQLGNVRCRLHLDGGEGVLFADVVFCLLTEVR